MYVQRNIEDDILRFMDRPEILAIVGPRQCGKTTMLKKLFSSLENAIFLSFEDHAILTLFETNIKKFIAEYVTGRSYVSSMNFSTRVKGESF